MIFRHRKILSEYYRFLLPDETVIEALVDKRGFAELAERVGLPVPRTFLPATIKELKEIAGVIRFPCILKLAHQDLWKEGKVVKALFDGDYKKAMKFHHHFSASGGYSVPISGTERLRQILRISLLGISVCRGIASTAPVEGLHQRECALPSRFK